MKLDMPHLLDIPGRPGLFCGGGVDEEEEEVVVERNWKERREGKLHYKTEDR